MLKAASPSTPETQGCEHGPGFQDVSLNNLKGRSGSDSGRASQVFPVGQLRRVFLCDFCPKTHPDIWRNTSSEGPEQRPGEAGRTLRTPGSDFWLPVPGGWRGGSFCCGSAGLRAQEALQRQPRASRHGGLSRQREVTSLCSPSFISSVQGAPPTNPRLCSGRVLAGALPSRPRGRPHPTHHPPWAAPAHRRPRFPQSLRDTRRRSSRGCCSSSRSSSHTPFRAAHTRLRLQQRKVSFKSLRSAGSRQTVGLTHPQEQSSGTAAREGAGRDLTRVLEIRTLRGKGRDAETRRLR